ncbi:MAG: metallophosphoesterase family protein [Fidelibacterota bacterium]
MNEKRFAIITDIHSNLTALQSALDIISKRKVDQLICLGDCFALGPSPVKTLKLLQTLDNCIFIRGNHDRYLLERIWEHEAPSLEGMSPDDPVCQGIVQNERWTWEQLGEEGMDFIRQMHIAHREKIGTILVEFTHAWYERDDQPPSLEEAITWRNHVKLRYPEVKMFLFIHGHTHIPRFDQNGNIKIFCQGATGLPFDRIPKGSVAFLTVGEDFKWEVERFDYDNSITIRRLDDLKPPFYLNLQNTIRYAEIRNEF